MIDDLVDLQRLPTADEINLTNTLDEEYAVGQLLGKTVEEVELPLREGCVFNLPEDLQVVGPYAFAFYVRALTRYVTGDFSRDDPDTVSIFVALMEWRLKCNDKESGWFPVAAVPNIVETIDYVLANYEKFDVTEEIYGDLQPRYVAVRERLEQLIHSC